MSNHTGPAAATALSEEGSAAAVAAANADEKGVAAVSPLFVYGVKQAWWPDGYSQIFQIVCVRPFGLLDYGSATLRCKICAPTPSTLAQSKERKGSNFAASRS